jgi:type I restriction enzyme M protein
MRANWRVWSIVHTAIRLTTNWPESAIPNHAWRGEKAAGAYEDVPGFCKSVTLDEIASHGYVLTPGRYVGAEEVEDDDEPFEEKVHRLTAKLEEQFKESASLEMAIRANLARLRSND